MKINLSRFMVRSAMETMSAVYTCKGKPVTISAIDPDKQECKVDGRWVAIKSLHIKV